MDGISSMDACYELRELIIGYDSKIIKDDEYIINAINQLDLNTIVERRYDPDIPIIRNKYKVTNLISIENKSH